MTTPIAMMRRIATAMTRTTNTTTKKRTS